MIVPAKSIIEYRSVFNILSKSFSIDKDLKKYFFYPLGRNALLDFLIKSKVKRGETIISPAYMCYSTIKPLVEYGYNIVFIDVDDSMSISLVDFVDIVKKHNISALIVVHYFGFVKDIKNIIEYCAKEKILLIEDYSHSFASLGSLKSDSDASIFSLRKTLPVAFGGMLRCKDHILYPDSYQVSCSNLTLTDIIHVFKMLVFKISISMNFNPYSVVITHLKVIIRGLKNNEGNKSLQSPVAMCQLPKSTYSMLIDDKFVDQYKNNHCKNYGLLLSKLKDIDLITPIQPILENGWVPQALPIRCKNATSMVKFLRGKGVGAYMWPGNELPDYGDDTNKYPNTVSFHKDIVLLPIHTSINKKHIRKIISTISRWEVEYRSNE